MMWTLCLQDRIVALTADSKDLEAKAHEAQTQHNRSALAKLEWMHEKEVLDRHIAQLNEELTSKSDILQALRASSSSEVRLFVWPCLQCQLTP